MRCNVWRNRRNSKDFHLPFFLRWFTPTFTLFASEDMKIYKQLYKLITSTNVYTITFCDNMKSYEKIKFMTFVIFNS